MSESFDPYLRWLGIRDPQRPPNHYRLLGLELFENDVEVIAVAADRQMAHVRSFQTGKLAAVSQRLLNELSAARICLLKPEKKVAYDESLRRKLADNASTSKPAIPQTPQQASSPAAATKISTTPGAARWIGPAVVAAITLIVGIVWVVKQTGSSDDDKTKLTGLPGTAPQSAPASVAAIAKSQRSLPPASANAQETDRSTESLSENRRGLAHFAMPGEQNVPVPFSAGGSRIGSKTELKARPADDVAVRPAAADDPSPSASQTKTVESPVQFSAPAAPAATASGTSEPGRPQLPLDNPASKLALVEMPPQPFVSAEPVGEQASGSDSARSESAGGKSAGSTSADTAKPGRPALRVAAAEKSAAPAVSAMARADVPAKEALDAAEKTIAGLFRTDFEQANRGGPDAKLALAKKLVQQAGDTSDDAAARYALLLKARDFAVQAGNVPDAIAAVDKLALYFSIDSPGEKFTTLAAIGKNLRTPEATQSGLDAAMEVTDEAIADDNHEVAAKLARLATGFATKARNAQAVNRLKARTAEIDQLKKEFAKAFDAKLKLASAPNDPEANFIYGYFQGPIKGDFDKALPYLAKGSDAALKDLAKTDMAAPSDSAQQTNLADGWRGVAEKLKPGIEKSHPGCDAQSQRDQPG